MVMISMKWIIVARPYPRCSIVSFFPSGSDRRGRTVGSFAVDRAALVRAFGERYGEEAGIHQRMIDRQRIRTGG